jgi:excisionase family DNA binding protein
VVALVLRWPVVRLYVTSCRWRILQEMQERHERQERDPMAPTMLTAQQVQDLLDVDASTIYRMAGDGRLPAVRIGRQWRFPADAIEALLVPPGTGTAGPSASPTSGPAVASAPLSGSPATSTLATTMGPAAAVASTVDRAAVDGVVPSLPVELATATLEAIAPALGVTMVVTDLDGQPLTPLVNPAPAVAKLADDPDFTAACSAEWRGFAHEPHLVPRLQPGRFGFLCAHSLVRHGTSLIAMVLAGGIAPDGDDVDLFHLDADRRAVVLETLPRTAALLSRLVAATAAVPAISE